MDKWIDAKKRMPKMYDDIIFYIHMTGDIMYGMYNNGYFLNIDVSGEMQSVDKNMVTHWMKFPEPPKLSDDDDAILQGFSSKEDMKNVLGKEKECYV